MAVTFSLKIQDIKYYQYTCISNRVVNDSGIGINAWFVGIGIGIGTHDAGIGIVVFWETLESESESESLATGIGIMDFGKPWNWNQSRP